MLGTGLSLLALAATVLMPLVVVCRTYRGLTLSDVDVPPCCASKASCAPNTDGPALAAGDGHCPYCDAAAPFRHAHPHWAPTFHAQWALLHREVPLAPRSRPGPAPDLTSAPPRAPPSAA